MHYRSPVNGPVGDPVNKSRTRNQEDRDLASEQLLDFSIGRAAATIVPRIDDENASPECG